MLLNYIKVPSDCTNTMPYCISRENINYFEFCLYGNSKIKKSFQVLELPGYKLNYSFWMGDRRQAQSLKWMFSRHINNNIRYISPIGLYLVVRVMLFNATFNNISVLSMEETGLPGENHPPATSHWQTLSHNVVSSTPRHEQDLNTTLVVILALITQVVVQPTTIWSRPWQSLHR